MRLFSRSTSSSSSTSLAAALSRATANTPTPLAQQEMLYLMGAAAREPPALVAAWAERMFALGKQPEVRACNASTNTYLPISFTPADPLPPQSTCPLHTHTHTHERQECARL
eukprot:2968979-Pleurochrysis_carterae.AAC.2